MEKRIAYIGLSYPMFYDYKNQAQRCENDISDSPNPIIESPLGLMILYDELWFLCESLCPDNMRRLPYVKFVDKLFPDFYYGNVYSNIRDQYYKGDFHNYFYKGLSFGEAYKRMNLNKDFSVDGHTHGIKLGNDIVSGSSNEDKIMFDFYIYTALKEFCNDNLEFLTNSFNIIKAPEVSFSKNVTDAEIAEKLVIRDIPNYLSVKGPYHECMEELRENSNLIDFRKWIIKNHEHVQKNEVDEMCSMLTSGIEKAKTELYKNMIEKNSGFNFFKSTAKTAFFTIAGIKFWPASVLDAFLSTASKSKEMFKAHDQRWQGFLLDAWDKTDFND